MNRPYVNVDEQLKAEREFNSKLGALHWYHGQLSRKESESLLEGKTDGCFLIRESSSCSKTIVLSAIFNQTPVHYQILRDNFCTFFLDHDCQPFIGLETLLVYLKNPKNSEKFSLLPKVLSSFIPGQLAPFDCLAKSPNLLLHEQCKTGDVKTVRAILCSTQLDKKCLNWRNESGDTPLHIAAQNGNTEIVRMLINSGAYLENINSRGETALHVSCWAGHFPTVTALIQHGASLNKFTILTKSTPLHICASRGQAKIFEWISQCGAALFAVNADRKTPLEVAQDVKCNTIVQFIINFKYPSPKFAAKQFLHAELSRYQAHDILKDHAASSSSNSSHSYKDGLFLVRGSKRCLGPVLTLISNNSLHNYEIQKRIFLLGSKEVEMYAVDDSPYFPSLELLIDYFASDHSLAAFKLTTPVGPIIKEPLNLNPQHVVNEGSNSYSEDPIGALFSHNAVLIGAEELNFGRTIGQGAYGEVVQAIWTRKGGGVGLVSSPAGSSPRSPLNGCSDGDIACSTSSVNVAVKKIVAMKDSNCQLDFLSEVRALFSINHPAIVKLIGISFGPPVMLITELVNGGSLLDYLIDNGDSITLQQMVAWSAQIARPLAYLESRKLIHRDLAARNILLKSYKMCKICDFGLSRMVGEGKDYYVATKGGKWPLRWYAPESVNRWHFSSASDVWSFGITLHEIFSYGAQPYGDLSWEEVFDLIDQGERLSQPLNCPDAIFQIMMSCWEYQPVDRPTFAELNSVFMSPEFLDAFSVPIKAITDPLAAESPAAVCHPVTNTDVPNASTSHSTENSQLQIYSAGSSGYGSEIKYVDTNTTSSSVKTSTADSYSPKKIAAVNVAANVYDVPVDELETEVSSLTVTRPSFQASHIEAIKPPKTLTVKDSFVKAHKRTTHLI